MADFDVFSGRGPIATLFEYEEIDLNIEGFKAKTYAKWSVNFLDHKDDYFLYSVKILFPFKKYKKYLFGLCKQVEYYKEWVEIPYSMYTPNFYSEYDPINVIHNDDLNKEYYLDLPEINTEEEWKSFTEKIKKFHRTILRRKR